MMEAGKFASAEKGSSTTWWIAAGMIAALIALVIFCNVQVSRGHYLGWNKPQKVVAPKVDNPGIDQHAYIQNTLVYVGNNLSAGTDVNKDGLVNCIDAAVLFYSKYPDKQRVAIEENRHPDGRMNHLFNVVFTNGVWRAVEPQAYWKNHKSYWMKDVWGSDYDNRYNKDVTELYKAWVK